MRRCNKCKIEKPASEFNKDKSNKSGLQYSCRDCQKKWRLENSEKIKEDYRKRYIKNRDEYKERAKIWAKQNPEKRQEICSRWRKNKGQEHKKKRYCNDPMYRMAYNIRNRTKTAFRRNYWQKNGATEQMLGADYKTVFSHIESRFKEGMTWKNQGEWHIDHIIPLSSARTEKELIELCHYTNLQPLWAKENLIKGDKIIACRINTI